MLESFVSVLLCDWFILSGWPRCSEILSVNKGEKGI